MSPFFYVTIFIRFEISIQFGAWTFKNRKKLLLTVPFHAGILLLMDTITYFSMSYLRTQNSFIFAHLIEIYSPQAWIRARWIMLKKCHIVAYNHGIRAQYVTYLWFRLRNTKRNTQQEIWCVSNIPKKTGEHFLPKGIEYDRDSNDLAVFNIFF